MSLRKTIGVKKPAAKPARRAAPAKQEHLQKGLTPFKKLSRAIKGSAVEDGKKAINSAKRAPGKAVAKARKLL